MKSDTPMTPLLTPKEREVLVAITRSNFYDPAYPTSHVFSFSVTDECETVTPAGMGGVIASLIKKGLAYSGPDEDGGRGVGKLDTVGLTREGVRIVVEIRTDERS